MLRNNLMGTDVLGGLDAVDTLKPATREPIAQITDASIGRTRVVGRDEYGNDIEQVVPCLASVMMLDTAGNELAVSIVNGRVPLPHIIKQYGAPKIAEKVHDGWLPKSECPLTRRYSNVVNTDEGTLIKPKKGDTMCGADQIEPHGCKHYIEVRDKRRALTAERAAARRAKTINPTQATLELAKVIAGYAEATGARENAMVAAVMERAETKRNPRQDG